VILLGLWVEVVLKIGLCRVVKGATSLCVGFDGELAEILAGHIKTRYCP